ncbi:DUF4115 domain-containing protein [Cellvibrio sp. KY-GH-1]|uniref:RodZ domain-containing protein n=1 Tax=Cellvibrio sp. KY-GH-1 TaxID=2303332 RepID=UPI0012460154|nr:RodZ domain-containing protein [Cellvibrio sp. KY-GH-1]QEY15424.1 DUF4115 domain-containing protein [Cellvibrio sp. KY-GH-1]
MVSDDDKKTTEDSRFRELSPGKLLVWGRERAGLSQEQIAKELYMTLTKVRALELDDYRHMGADTFTRGYLGSYANLVKLDVVQVLAAYDRHAQKYGLNEQVLPKKQESATKPLWQFVALIVVVLLVLWLISVWFFDNRKEPEYDLPVAIVPAVEVFSSSSVAESSMATESSASGGLSPTTLDEVSIPATDMANQFSSSSSSIVGLVAESSVGMSNENTDSRSSSSISTGSSRVGVLDEIEFTFTEECWLEVSDSSGDVLVADLQAAGVHLVLQGRAPFDIKLGNAPAVQIELNNEQITLVPAIGTNVLSVKVGKTPNN